jgi:hypothetical protein
MKKGKRQQGLPSWAAGGHGRPTTRREFLAHGLIPFAAYLAMPQLIQVLSSQAHAATCAGGVSSLLSKQSV